jgi:hypothetical protein
MTLIQLKCSTSGQKSGEYRDRVVCNINACHFYRNGPIDEQGPGSEGQNSKQANYRRFARPIGSATHLKHAISRHVELLR